MLLFCCLWEKREGNGVKEIAKKRRERRRGGKGGERRGREGRRGKGSV